MEDDFIDSIIILAEFLKGTDENITKWILDCPTYLQSAISIPIERVTLVLGHKLILKILIHARRFPLCLQMTLEDHPAHDGRAYVTQCYDVKYVRHGHCAFTS